ncbi:hypothetical protein AVEN_160081-1 [Araneus ventricosus]|uniref:Mos1 transposase HTH domain-containing protein n=1 Tax=Araneus ventricosus TaxID=182803 RepID=A0A4Y2WMX8_ARAVE|nr:hypothetical protein AVEN_160081-1 [Araneus ventricosus]
MSSLEQKANIKFCVLLEKSPSETLEMLKKAYGNGAMKKKRLCTSGISVSVKVEQTSKMTLGLGAPPLPPQMKMLSAFEKSCVKTDELTIDALNLEFHMGVFTAFFMMI